MFITIKSSFFWIGCAAFATDQFMNFEFMYAAEKAITSTVVAVPVVGLVAVASIPSLGAIWQIVVVHRNR